VALTREPLVINGPFDPGVFAVSAGLDPPAESAMFAPLVNRGQLLGVLNVFSHGREFSADHLRPMMLFAEQAALSIVNSRLYETERRRVAELRQLNLSG
jgi:GAF domain-containing protein